MARVYNEKPNTEEEQETDISLNPREKRKLFQKEASGWRRGSQRNCQEKDPFLMICPNLESTASASLTLSMSHYCYSL